MARFEFSADEADGSLSIRVYRPVPSAKPFFSAKLRKIRHVPSIPLSTGIAKYIGLDLRLAQPPLPSGSASPDLVDEYEESEHLCGTKDWKACLPEIWGRSALCWIDIQKLEEDEVLIDVGTEQSRKDWWPAYKPWSIGAWIENGTFNFTDTEIPGLGRG